MTKLTEEFWKTLEKIREDDQEFQVVPEAG